MYRRAVQSNNPLWMRWVDEATARLDPALHAERMAERFTGRPRSEIERTTREDVTIIFADLVDFTPRTVEISPEQVMSTVRGLFELGVPLFTRHQVLPLTPLDLRAGVASGAVVLGTLRTLFKTEHAAIGHTTNLAARLQGAAKPGEVVCSAEVAHAAAQTEGLRASR